MLGYCHNDECGLDIWSPDYVLNTPSHHYHVLNRAFSPYAKHEQEKEDVIKAIKTIAESEMFGDFTFNLDDDFSDGDIKEMMDRLREQGYCVL